MKLHTPGTWLVLALAWAGAAAGAGKAASHDDVIAFIKSAGFQVCQSVPNDPPKTVVGATGKHLLEVARDCAAPKPEKSTVLFTFEYDTPKNRDDAVEHFRAAYGPAILESGSAWPIGERFAIFAAGPSHAEVQAALEAEVKRRGASAG